MNDTIAFYKAVGQLVRAARDKAGLTQNALASRLGLTRTSVTNIEKGRQKVLLHTFCDLAGGAWGSASCAVARERGSSRKAGDRRPAQGASEGGAHSIRSAIVSARKDN